MPHPFHMQIHPNWPLPDSHHHAHRAIVTAVNAVEMSI